eukprot:jgi/Tetstr1/433584/TSEL_022851.t1
MAHFVWVNVPELRRNNESAVIQQTAWAFAVQHEDGNIIKREARVVVRGDQLTAGENYDDTKTYAPVMSFIALRTAIALAVQLTRELYQLDASCVLLNADRNADDNDYLPLGCGRKNRAWTPVEALYDLPQAPKAWFMWTSSFPRDFAFIRSEPGGVIHLHRETCINDILTTFHMTESKPRRLPCTLNTNFHNPAVTYHAQVQHGMITGAQRHIDLKFQYAAQLCQDGVIDMHYTPTTDQLADFFTKALPLTTFLRFRAFLMGSSEEPCVAPLPPSVLRPRDSTG